MQLMKLGDLPFGMPTNILRRMEIVRCLASLQAEYCCANLKHLVGLWMLFVPEVRISMSSSDGYMPLIGSCLRNGFHLAV